MESAELSMSGETLVLCSLGVAGEAAWRYGLLIALCGATRGEGTNVTVAYLYRMSAGGFQERFLSRFAGQRPSRSLSPRHCLGEGSRSCQPIGPTGQSFVERLARWADETGSIVPISPGRCPWAGRTVLLRSNQSAASKVCRSQVIDALREPPLAASRMRQHPFSITPGSNHENSVMLQHNLPSLIVLTNASIPLQS